MLAMPRMGAVLTIEFNMDFDKLLNPIADYFNFVVDFVVLGGLSPYVRLGSVSPKLVSFLFIGLIFALVIKRAKVLPTVGQDVRLSTFLRSQSASDETTTQHPDAVPLFASSELLLFVLFQITGTLFFHLSLVISSKFIPLETGNFKDSLNVTIAVSSVQYPVQAALQRLITFMQKIQNFNLKTRIIAICIYLIWFGMLLLFAFYFFHAAAIFHSIPSGKLIVPAAITIVLTTLAILLLFYFIRIWQKMYLPQR